INGDKVKALAVTTADRSTLYPDLPTMQESGVEKFDLGSWFGVFATGGTPRPIIDKLNAAYAKALRDPDVRKNLLTMGSTAEPTTPEALADLVKHDLAKYKEVVETSGAKLF